MTANNKITWTLKEACEATGIGINKMRDIVFGEDHDWVLYLGTSKKRALIKVDKFKEWLYRQKNL